MERSVFTQRIHTDQFDFIDNRFHGVLSKEVSRQMVSVLDAGRLGFASGTIGSDLDTLTVEARQLCPFSRTVAYRFPTEGSSEHHAQNVGVDDLAEEEIVELCESIVDTVNKRLPEMTIDVIARRTYSEVGYSNSHGVEHHGEEKSLSYALIAQLSSEEDLFSEYKEFDHRLHSSEGAEKLERFFDKLQRHLPIVEFTNGEFPALVLAQTLESFLTGFWQSLDGKRLHERQSPLAGKSGMLLFDPRFSLEIDPLAQGTGNFDVEGVAAGLLPLVEKGVLRGAFYDLEFAQKTGHPASGLATGNLRERFRTEPIRIGSRGTLSNAELLERTGRAVIIQHAHEVSRTTNLKGDFSCGVDALLFADGEVKGRIKNLNMSANLFDLFRDGVAAFSSEGEDAPSLGVMAPHILFKSIRFAV